MKAIHKAVILKNMEIAPKIFEMDVEAREIVNNGLPGQFVNVYCGRGQHLLPRPISIYELDKEDGILKLVYGVVGKGTTILSQMQEGDIIKIMGPLGNGFTIPEEAREHLVVGGGIGTPPLVELVKHLKGNVTVCLGFRSHPILIETLKKYGAKVLVATEDGSAGYKGNVIELLDKNNIKAEMIYSCGPKAMLRAVASWAREKSIPVQVSLEERMACGIGACLVCTCKTKMEEDEDWQNRRVCKDGPVFWGDEVIWE